jgi:hypothetical protein
MSEHVDFIVEMYDQLRNGVPEKPYIWRLVLVAERVSHSLAVGWCRSDGLAGIHTDFLWVAELSSSLLSRIGAFIPVSYYDTVR